MRKILVYCYYQYLSFVLFSVIFIDKSMNFVYNDTHGAVKTANMPSDTDLSFAPWRDKKRVNPRVKAIN
jgi:hypothetical protein